MRWSLFVLLSTAFTGCIWKVGDSSGAPQASGDITFLWSFDGKTCDQASEVRTIQVTIKGPDGLQEKLEANGEYRCSTQGSDGIWRDGIRLSDFRPGTYTCTLDALDANDKPIYHTNPIVTVDGDVEVYPDLNRVNRQALVQIYWSFGSARSMCKDAGLGAGLTASEGVSKVNVSVDGQAPQPFPCTDTSSGVLVEGIAVKLGVGTHHLLVEGIIVRGGQEQTWYSASPSVTVAADQTTNLPVALDLVAAQATFVPTLDGSSAFPCASAGVGALFIELADSGDKCRTDVNGDSGLCGKFNTCDNYAAGIVIDYIPVKQSTANWTARIEGWDQDASAHRVVYEGTATVTISAASTVHDRYPVPMVKK